MKMFYGQKENWLARKIFGEVVGQFGHQDFMISRCGEQAGGQFIFVSQCSNLLSGIKFVWWLGALIVAAKNSWVPDSDFGCWTSVKHLTGRAKVASFHFVIIPKKIIGLMYTICPPPVNHTIGRDNFSWLLS